MSECRHNGLIPTMRRVRLIAGQTMVDALRLRMAGLMAVMAALLLLGSRWLRDLNFGTAELAFLGDFGLAVIGLSGMGLAALATSQLFFADLAAGAAACILTRPVRRWEYLAGKFAGIAGLLAIFMLLIGGLLAALMLWRAQELDVAVAGLSAFLGACSLQWMKATLVAAMTLCVSAYAGSALFAACTGLLLAVIGHLHPLATGALEWLRIWPNLTLFEAGGMLAGSQWPAGAELLRLGAYWAVCVLLLGLLASYAFKHREL